MKTRKMVLDYTTTYSNFKRTYEIWENIWEYEIKSYEYGNNPATKKRKTWLNSSLATSTTSWQLLPEFYYLHCL